MKWIVYYASWIILPVVLAIGLIASTPERFQPLLPVDSMGPSGTRPGLHVYSFKNNGQRCYVAMTDTSLEMECP